MENINQILLVEQAYGKLKLRLRCNLSHVKDIRTEFYGSLQEMDFKYTFYNFKDQEEKDLVENGLIMPKGLALQLYQLWKSYQAKQDALVLPKLLKQKEVDFLLLKKKDWEIEELKIGKKEFDLNEKIPKFFHLKSNDNMVTLSFFDRNIILKRLQLDMEEKMIPYKKSADKQFLFWNIQHKSLYKKDQGIPAFQPMITFNYRGSGRGTNRGQRGSGRGSGRGSSRGRGLGRGQGRGRENNNNNRGQAKRGRGSQF